MRSEASVTFACEDCGCDFTRKARYARMIRNGEREQKCRRCLRVSEARPVTDSDRRYWLTRFSDIEIASFATLFFDIPFRPAAVAQRRYELMGGPVPEVMLAAGVEVEEDDAFVQMLEEIIAA